MKHYYFLASALPELQIGLEPEISWESFCHLLEENLTQKDQKSANTIRLLYDIENIRALWKGEELDPHGNLDALELEEALIAQEGLPDYVYDFMRRYDSKELKLHHFPSLLNSYFVHESQSATGFLNTYLAFEREWRLVMVGFRTKQLQRDPTIELQFEETTDDLVAQIIAQRDAKTYLPPENYEDLTPLFEGDSNTPLKLFQDLCVYRFTKIDEMIGISLFSIDFILSYMAKLITAEKWMQLDREKGQKILNQILPTESRTTP